MTDDQVRALRMRAQGLDGSGGDVVDVVRRVVGLPAQLLPASPLAVRARTRGLTASDVDRARLEERSIVWTWAMRGTLHLVAAEDLGWMNALFGPVGVARGRRRLRELGVDDDAAGRGVAVIRDALSRHGPLTRNAIAEELRAGGVDVEPGTQAVIHLIFRAALEGVLCGGPDQDGEPAYVLLSDWVEVEPPGSDGAALSELARRYFAGYGPAEIEDLAAWSGLPMARARAAADLAGGEAPPRDRRGADASARGGSAAAGRPREPIVRLLGSFDPYLLGYRGRDLAVAPEHARRILPGGGVLRPTAIVDGRAVAVWRQQKRGNRLLISLEPFEELDSEIARRLEADAQDLARFVGAELRLG